MSRYLFEKEVDQSLLKAGLTIPVAAHNAIQDAVGVRLTKGERTDIRIRIANQIYDAILTHVNLNEHHARGDVFQIRYGEKSPIGQKMQEIFSYIDFSNSSADKSYIEVYSNEDHSLEFKMKSKLKEAFFKYLGPVDSLAGYQRSYKLVLLNSFFARVKTNQDTTCNAITSDFRDYYLQRKYAGLVPDVNVDPIIENVESSTLSQIYNLIIRNPYNAISNNGFMTIENERFILVPELEAQLSSGDVDEIIRIVDQKLKLYFSKVDVARNGGSCMREIVEKMLNDYVPAKAETFSGHPLGTYFRKDIPQKIYDTGLVDSSDYLVTGSVGQGNWAMIPWVCIFDRSITTSATKGVYIVYLLEKNGGSLYLTFNQGCTEIRNSHSKRETIKIMREKAAEIVSSIDSRGFRTDEEINLGSGLTELGELYQKGTIFYKEYKKDAIPEEAELQSDLAKMMDIYREYAKRDVSGQHKTWLLSWNPDNWDWEDYQKGVYATKNGAYFGGRWSCASTHVVPGDRVFLIVLGKGDKNGITASGFASSGSYESEHWNKEKRDRGIKVKRIDIKFDCIYDYLNQDILKQSVLTSLFPEQQWSPQGSGIEIKSKYVKQLEEEWNKLRKDGGEAGLTVKETVEKVKDYIAAKGFTYPDGMIENFYLSLKSKPFVILAGTSGTGKTRLVRLFAEAVGATTENGRYKMVSVRPDWSDSSDLFGHVDLNGQFIPGAIIDFINQAAGDSTHPYFLCLDEMNLARVEYYLSDFLSIIETREFKAGHILSDPLVPSTYYGGDADAAAKYGTLTFPENLYIVGTVNMDETTFPFSRKVLDRANTIEFSFVDLTPPVEWTAAVPVAMDLDNEFLKTKYLLLAECKEQQENINAYCVELVKINEILRQANAHVGYRVRDEIVFYLLNNKEAGLLDEDKAMDNAIMQKILPRIQGSSASIKKMLCELFKVCAGDYEGQNTESELSAKMMKTAEKANCKYQESAKKIAFMVRRYEEDGFTSYWL